MIDKIEVLTNSCIRINHEKGRIYVDPYNIKNDFYDADYVFITHPHDDHYSPKDIRKVIKPETNVIVPECLKDDALEFEHEVRSIISVAPGVYKSVQDLEFETIPAYNLIRHFHQKRAGWVGYLIRSEGGRIYIAGDTSLTPEAKNVKCNIALVPIGGTYTMGPKKAAELINIIQPEYAIPTHYGCVDGKPEYAKTFAANIHVNTTVLEKIQYYE